MTKEQLIDELEKMYRAAQAIYQKTGDLQELGAMVALDRAITLAGSLNE